MTKAPLGKQEKEIIENYLSGYASNRLILGAERYLELYSESKDGYLSLIDRDMLNEAPLAKSRMFSVRHFILSLPNGNEKLLLYYHYVRGESVERCAELLGISRRSAFRLKNRALSAAYSQYAKRFSDPVG